MVQRVTFSSEEMEFSKRDKNSLGQGGFEVVKREVKWEEKQFPISALSVIQAPVGNLRKSMEVLLLLIIVETWKNLVLRS
jgi:hypothetical protein